MLYVREMNRGISILEITGFAGMLSGSINAYK
jgi:hypothetical protein